MDLEREERRQRFRLCRLSFALIGVALVLASIDTALALTALFTANRALPALQAQPWWRLAVGTPITWCSLAGASLLWGRWTDASWQRRTGALSLMCTIDVVLWAADHADALGLPAGRTAWMGLLGRGLGWAEFALIAGLAGEVAAHLGHQGAQEATRSAQAVAAVGALVWIASLLGLHGLHLGLPADPAVRALIALLYLGAEILWITALFRSTALTIAAARYCALAVAEIDAADRADDLLRSRSEQPDEDRAAEDRRR